MPRISPAASTVTIELDGDQLQAREGEPVACAVLANDDFIFGRSPKYHRPRGPFCLTGACSQCLMRVDGIPNVATCRVPVKAGMRLERQNALPDGKLDLLRANDFVFRDWFNHHEFLAGWPLADQVLLKVARQLSGLGLLPEREAAQREPAIIEKHPLVIVGAGAAGLAAAKELTARGVPHVLFERESKVGGRLISGAERGQPDVFKCNARTNAEVIGLFDDDGSPFLAVRERQRLHLVFFERILLTVGGHPALPTFPNNDLPGVMAGRAVATLIRRHDVLPGKRIACVGEATEARALAELVKAAGGEAVAVGAEIVRAHGLRQVTAVTTEPGGKQDCDVIATCGPLSPAFELARAAGASVAWNATSRFFEVQADAQGRTANERVFVAGEMRGPMSAAAAAEQGLAAATALSRPLPDPLPSGGEGGKS
jgi:sarcosine oxidase subunit alpha